MSAVVSYIVGHAYGFRLTRVLNWVGLAFGRGLTLATSLTCTLSNNELRRQPVRPSRVT